MGNKGQVQVTFNWVYVAIAGVIILLFFVGLVFKQKAKSEERLTLDVVLTLDSIFKGASVSEKTKNFIDISGLADYSLYFDCEEDVSFYGIEGQSARSESSVVPNVKGPILILWSLPYKMPFKVIDFLFVTSSQFKYLVVGSGDFADEFLELTEENYGEKEVSKKNLRIKREFVEGGLDGIDNYQASSNLKYRIIDADGIVVDGSAAPNFDVSAVSFRGDEFDYFEVEEGRWKKTNREPIRVVSIQDRKDPARYAAVFSEDETIYNCNMAKAYKRVEYVTNTYEKKLDGMIARYEDDQLLQLTKSGCLANYKNAPTNLKQTLILQQTRSKVCNLEPSTCFDLKDSGFLISDLNSDLEGDACITLY
jgi:hypothetical protein